MKFQSSRTAVTPQRPDPNRCQFSTADDRQCRMSRWEGHVSFCLFHARVAASEAHKMAQLLALEEVGQDLVSLSGEFKTASDVNHFLGKLLLLIAQDRIPHRNAVAMAYICQLLLCTLDSVRHEITNEGPGFSAWKAMVAKALSSRLPQQS